MFHSSVDLVMQEEDYFEALFANSLSEHRQ